MKTEIYKKVYIKSIDDLPKERGYYAVHQKGFEPDYVISMFWNGISHNFWEQVYDWYLLPIELPSDEEWDKFTKWFEVAYHEPFGTDSLYEVKAFMRDQITKQ